MLIGFILKRVLTYGTFDLTHVGHINLLRNAHMLGDYLVVGLSTDEFNNAKGKSSTFPYEHRRIILESIRYVNLVIPETTWKQKELDIVDLKIDLLVMGDDWRGAFDHLSHLCEIIYLPRTANVSSTIVKQKILLGDYL